MVNKIISWLWKVDFCSYFFVSWASRWWAHRQGLYRDLFNWFLAVSITHQPIDMSRPDAGPIVLSDNSGHGTIIGQWWVIQQTLAGLADQPIIGYSLWWHETIVAVGGWVPLTGRSGHTHALHLLHAPTEENQSVLKQISDVIINLHNFCIILIDEPPAGTSSCSLETSSVIFRHAASHRLIVLWCRLVLLRLLARLLSGCRWQWWFDFLRPLVHCPSKMLHCIRRNPNYIMITSDWLTE